MPDKERRTILDRAERMLRQSKVLRKVSEDLLQESRDVRASVDRSKGKSTKPRPPKK